MVVGALLVVDALVVLLQVRLAVVWEQGFYGRVSTLSAVLGLTGGLALGAALLAGLGGLRYGFGFSAGRSVLLASLILMCFVPEPLAWLLLGSSVLVVGEQWRGVLARRRDAD